MDRRHFLRNAALAGAGLGLSGRLAAAPLRTGANDRLTVAVMGVNSRGQALAEIFARVPGTEVAVVCDVDRRAVDKTVAAVKGLQARVPRGLADVRRALEDPDVDALVIAAPDHWHAPATLMALQAGKHVYVEKPCGHNPREGELLVAAQQRYGRVVQMGTQQRSAPTSIQAIREIREGAIGRPYLGRAWYSNTRGSIGRGKPAPVPDGLDWDLWQGPAPRTDYRDNVVHYNWHWFWRWGTGESCNNGTHEIDVCRWALGVDYPVRVTSTGGRYHYDDDWEFYDTQTLGFDFEGNRSITWEGRSCNGFALEGMGRGASIHGTEGTYVIDRNGYIVYDLKGKKLKEVKESEVVQSTIDTVGAGGEMTDLHVANFAAAVRGEAAPNAPIDEGHKSVLLCHLGNIAQRVGRTLHPDPATGRLSDPDVAPLWGRTYEPGWEMVV